MRDFVFFFVLFFALFYILFLVFFGLFSILLYLIFKTFMHDENFAHRLLLLVARCGFNVDVH